MTAILMRILMDAGRPAVQQQTFKVKYHNMILLENVTKGNFKDAARNGLHLQSAYFPLQGLINPKITDWTLRFLHHILI